MKESIYVIFEDVNATENATEGVTELTPISNVNAEGSFDFLLLIALLALAFLLFFLWRKMKEKGRYRYKR